MGELSQCFLTQEKQLLAVIGSGGKTSLIRYLSHKCRQQKTIVSTTTKIGYPKKEDYDFLYTNSVEIDTIEKSGITIIGKKIQVKDGTLKLSQPTNLDLKELFKKVDKIFLEADGSKQLPLKGWETFEPVVPEETTETIGIIPIKVLGRKISSEIVHRLPIFLNLTNTTIDEEITIDILVKIIQKPKGLFQKAKGKRVLFLNQVDSLEDTYLAKKICERLIQDSLDIDKIISGSTLNKTGVILWEKYKNQ